MFTVFLLFAQISIGEVKQGESDKILKPAPYDSLVNFISLYAPKSNSVNYKQYIGMQFYLPQFKNSEKSQNKKRLLYNTKPVDYNELFSYVYKPFVYGVDNSKSLASNDESISNQYYTLIDILNKEVWKKIRTDMWNTLDLKEKESVKVCRKIIKPYKRIFLLRNDISGDTLYCEDEYIESFILVPFFIKHKQLYEDKTYLNYAGSANRPALRTNAENGDRIPIPYLSKWSCKVDLLNIDYSGKKLNFYRMYRL